MRQPKLRKTVDTFSMLIGAHLRDFLFLSIVSLSLRITYSIKKWLGFSMGRRCPLCREDCTNYLSVYLSKIDDSPEKKKTNDKSSKIDVGLFFCSCNVFQLTNNCFLMVSSSVKRSMAIEGQLSKLNSTLANKTKLIFKKDSEVLLLIYFSNNLKWRWVIVKPLDTNFSWK